MYEFVSSDGSQLGTSSTAAVSNAAVSDAAVSSENMRMIHAIEQITENPNLTVRAFCNTHGLDDAFRIALGKYVKDLQLLEGESGQGKNNPNEIVKKSVTDAWNLVITTQYSKEELFAKVPVEGVSNPSYYPTLLGTLAKKEFGQRIEEGKWKLWLSRKINKGCKAIYTKRAADAAGLDL